MNRNGTNGWRGEQPQRQLFTKSYLQNNRMQSNSNGKMSSTKNNSIHQRLGFQTNSQTNHQTGIKSRLGFNRPPNQLSAVAVRMTKRKLQIPKIRKDIIRKNVINNLQITNGGGSGRDGGGSKAAVSIPMRQKQQIDFARKSTDSATAATHNLIVAERHSIRAQLNPKLQEEIRRLQCKKDFSTPLTLGYTGRTLNDRFSTL